MIQRFKGGYEIVTDDAADCVGPDPLAHETSPPPFETPADAGLYSREAEARALGVFTLSPDA